MGDNEESMHLLEIKVPCHYLVQLGQDQHHHIL